MSTTRINRLMIGASARFNYEWALRYPGSPPFIMMTEFPRSGGNWIRDMLSDVLQIPAPRFSKLPITFKAIAHSHDHRVIENNPCIYVYRDGRDVFLSHFHKTVTAFENGMPFLQKRILKLHPSLEVLFKDSSRESINLVNFYKEWSVRPLGSHINWGQHVSAWFKAKPPRTVFISYERMRASPEEALKDAAESLGYTHISREVIDFSVWRNSFESQTGRVAGSGVSNSTKRMGVAGAWVDYMPEKLKSQFASDYGDVLEMAGFHV